jgi:DNA repair exonuclease SbcCD nuclease subunit
MRLCISADAHVGVNGKLKDIMWAMSKIRQYNHERDIDTWFMLGDLMHDRESVGTSELYALTQFLDDTDIKYGQQMHVLVGNHDMYLKNSWEINSLRPLSRHIKVYDSVQSVSIDGRRIWILPFIYYENEYMARLAEIESNISKDDILFTHIGVRGAKFNACFLLQSWSTVDFAQSAFQRVLAGHFHCHQEVGRVTYPGSIIPYKFDEGDVDHGFLILDTDTLKCDFVSIWDGVKPGEYRPPQYLTFDSDDLSDLSLVNGNVIRILTSKEYITQNKLMEIRQSVIDAGAVDVRWMHIATKDDVQSIEMAKMATSKASELFERYMNADKSAKELNSSLLLKMNSEIVAEGDRLYEVQEDVSV